MGQRIDIGIDGGGTGCRVIVCADGREARGKAGPANVVSNPDGAQAAILEALDQAMATLALDDLSDARIVAGLAGCRLPGTADAFATRLPFLAHVVDDSVTALEGAFGGAHGTLVNLGTGSFFIRRDDRGVTHQGGWGFQLGDAGSAAWLGKTALSELLMIEDGSLRIFKNDPLKAALKSACGTHPVVFAQGATPSDFAALAPIVFNHSSLWAKTLHGRLESTLRGGLNNVGHPGGTPWVLSGGLGEALTERLDGQITAGLQPPNGSALDGALSMARALP